MEIAISILLLICIPVLLKITENNRFVSFISPIALAYAAGFIVSILEIPRNIDVIKDVCSISIALSISLLVLASNLKKFKTFIRPLLKAFSIGILSLLIAITIVVLTLGNIMEESNEVMAMLTGVYVGGTGNMNAIGAAVSISSKNLMLVNTAEVIFGGIYFLLLITVIKPILSIFLKKYKPGNFNVDATEEVQPLKFKAKLTEIVKSIVLAIIVLGTSSLIVMLLYDEMNDEALLILLTTLSVFLGQLGFIQKIKLKFETGDFLLLIFSFGIGMMVDFAQIFNGGLQVYYLVASVFFITIIIHIILAKVFNIDVDTLMISATAALYGPAFIAPVAKAIGNKELIIYGIALGLLGYIIAIYLGLGIYNLLLIL